jgi:hypothetical protein
MRVALLSSALLILGLSFPQGEGKPIPPTTPTPGSKAVIQATLAEMQGAWRLKQFDSPQIEKVRRQEAGYLLVAGKCFSFELHLSWSTVNNDPNLRTSLSGTHSFELDQGLRMTARQLIGASSDNTGIMFWEEPGKVRIYDVLCRKDVLQLKREDGTLYEFERIIQDTQPRDIYGRPLKVKDPNAPKTPPQEPPKEPKKN